MAIYKNTPPIVTNGLVLNWDAANQALQTSRNLFNFTTDLTNAFWSKFRCQITASAGIAPDGTNTAFAMTITDATGLVRLASSAFTASVEGGPYTFSYFVSRSNCTAGIVQLGIYDGVTNIGTEPNYAIQANFVQSGSAGIFAPIRRTTDVGNSWYRIATTVTLPSSIHTFRPFIDIEDGYGGNKVNGENLMIWGPQFEAGPIATPYQPVPTTVRFTPDLSGNNNTGSFSTNRPTWTPNGGGSVAFLGSNTVNPTLTYQSTPTINISGSSMTGEIWVKFNSLDYVNSSGSLMYFFRKGVPDLATPNEGIWFVYDNRNNALNFAYTCFGNTAGGFAGGNNNFSGANYNQIFTTGSWNHIAFTINNSTGSFFINGAQKGPSKNFSNLNLYNTGSSSTGTADFGSVVPSKPAPFEIAALRLYNIALTSQQIAQNYNALKSRFNLS